MAKKVAQNMREEKYNNAIKYLNLYKKNPPVGETPLKAVLPILEQKMQTHIKKIFDSFWRENKTRMVEIGGRCLGKITSNLK